jgi:glycosyltransferase involved in cell wall biosynthesis
MRILFVCEAVDRADPMQPTTVSWIETLAGKPGVERVDVLALRVGEHGLPPNVRVRRVKGSSRLATVLRFYGGVLAALARGLDAFFVYQGGPYPLLLLPFRLLLGTRIYQWKAHPHASRTMRLTARFVDTKVFTSTRHAFPMALSTLRVVGQGIRTDVFTILPGAKLRRLVTVGRIAPVKRIDLMLRALGEANRGAAVPLGLDLVGPVEDVPDHVEALRRIVVEEGLGDLVAFRGPVRQEELPAILNRHAVFLHFCDGALDKTVAEAMACGLPVLSTNACVAEILPPDLRALLILPEGDVEGQAARILAVAGAGEERLREIGRRLRDVIVANHGVSRLFDRIVAEMTDGDEGNAYQAAAPGLPHRGRGALVAQPAREAGHRAS